MESIIYIGIDVHKDTYSLCSFDRIHKLNLRLRIDFFQVTADSLQVFVRNELCRIPDHMDNTMLNMRIGKDCFHSIRKSCKPVHTGNENIFNSTVFYVR